jgi:hypothetical protein
MGVRMSKRQFDAADRALKTSAHRVKDIFFLTEGTFVTETDNPVVFQLLRLAGSYCVAEQFSGEGCSKRAS